MLARDLLLECSGPMQLEFEGFEVDVESGRLLRDGREVPLEKRALEMLCYLARHPGRLITKDELLVEVWGARTLSDGALANAAAKLRKALGQDANARTPVETVRGRGFRWNAAAFRRTRGEHPAAVAPVRSEPFVGRAAALALLERALDDAEHGNGQFVLLTGDAGMGKTRTLEEIAARARTRGFSVWEGAAPDGAGVPPYWLWVEVLRSAHADLSSAMFRRNLPVDGWAMRLLVPELIGSEPRPDNSDTAATRFRLFDEVSRFVMSAARAGPRLILADDLHWADEGTLELLAYLARALKKHPIVIAATRRPSASPEADLRTSATRLARHASHVELLGLSVSEVGALAEALHEGCAIDAATSEALYERTHGNPFFVRQTVELLAQQGTQLRSDALQTLAVPMPVRSVLRQRFESLPLETRAVLRMAAAIGVDFDAGVLASALERSLVDVLASLEPARRTGAVVVQTKNPHQLAFRHALVRDAIYDALELAVAGELHARIARTLEQQHRVDVRSLGELAKHALLAVPADLERCVRHCTTAADAARSALGYEAAADLLARAEQKLASEGGDPLVRCELLLSLGVDRFYTGDIRNGWRALEEGALLAERTGSPDYYARFTCLLAAWLELGGGDESDVRRRIDRALASTRDPDLRAGLLAHRAEIEIERSAEQRVALLDEAEQLAAAGNSPRTLLEIAVCRASLRDPTRLEDSCVAISRYRDLARKHAAHIDIARHPLQNFAIELGDYLRALTACDLVAADGAIERCRSIARESQVFAVELAVELMEAGRALGDGRLGDLEARVQRLNEGATLVGGFGLVGLSYGARLVELRDGFASLAGLLAVDWPPQGFGELRPSQRMNGTLWLARLSAKVGAHDRARQLLASIDRAQLARMPVRYGDLGLLCFLAETYEVLDDRESAEALHAQLFPHVALNAVLPTFDYAGAVGHYVGRLARMLGREREAARCFAQAREINLKLRLSPLPM